MKDRPSNSRTGVGLIEIIALLGMLGFLLAFLLPIVQSVRNRARQVESTNNLKQLGLATHNCVDAYRLFPPAVGAYPTGTKSNGTVHFYLLPFIEQNNVFQKAKRNVANEKTYGVRITVFLSPQARTAPPKNLYDGWLATCNYPANYLVFEQGNRTFAQIPDGTSNTMMFTERYQMCNGMPHAWGYAHLYYWAPLFGYYSQGKFQNVPKKAECDPRLPQSLDPSGILVGMCDGSVRIVSPSVSPWSWANASDPRDGMVLENDF